MAQYQDHDSCSFGNLLAAMGTQLSTAVCYVVCCNAFQPVVYISPKPESSLQSLDMLLVVTHHGINSYPCTALVLLQVTPVLCCAARVSPCLSLMTTSLTDLMSE